MKMIEANAEELKIMKTSEYQVWRNTELLGGRLLVAPLFLAALLFMGAGLVTHITALWFVGSVWVVICLVALYKAYPDQYTECRAKMWGIRKEVG